MTRPLILLSAGALLLACTAAGTNAPSSGNGGHGGSSAAGTAGAAGTGSGVSGTTGTAGVISIGGSGGTGGERTCGLQNFDVERKPAEILLLLDRSKSMIEDTTSDGVTLKWNAVIPALKQVIMDTNAAVSWGLKVFPEGEGSECIAGTDCAWRARG